MLLTPLFSWLLLTQSPFVALAAALGLVGFVLVTRRPELGLYFMVLSVPVQDKVILPVGGRLTLTQAAVILTLVAWYANRTAYKKPLVRRPLPPLLPFFLIYIAVQIASLTVATSVSDGLAEISRWLITFFAYLLATNVIETRRQFWTLVIVLIIGAVGEAGLGVVQTRLGVGPESFAISENLTRAFGTFEFPNPFAGYLEMALPMLVALGFAVWRSRNFWVNRWLTLGEAGQSRQIERRQVIQNWFWLALLIPAVGLVLLGVVASYSRGSWLGLTAALLVMIAIRGKKSIGLWVAIVLLLVFGIVGLQTGAINPAIVTRLSSITEQLTPFDVREVRLTDENFAVVQRMAMWQAGGNMFLSNPWLGVGVGNFNATYPQFYPGQWLYSQGHAHNYYIHSAAETGIIGISAYLALLVVAFGRAIVVFRETRDGLLRYVAWGGLGIIIAVAIHNLVENLHVLNLGIQWSAVLALFYLIPQLDKAAGQLEGKTE